MVRDPVPAEAEVVVGKGTAVPLIPVVVPARVLEEEKAKDRDAVAVDARAVNNVLFMNYSLRRKEVTHMPGFDGTGPMGGGPMTGGGRGYCNPAGQGVPYYGYGRGLGLARGFRGGRGSGRFAGYPRGGRFAVYPPVNPAVQADEIGTLKANAEELNRQLEAIHARIAELEKG